MKELYRLQLDDFSAAAFTSFGKDYFGTMEQIQSLFDCLRSDQDIAGRFQYILSVFDRYRNGEPNITHNVAYQEVPFLIPATVLHEAKSVLHDYSWTHMNTWEWPYYMKFDKAESMHLWVACNDGFCRCIQTVFHNLTYGTDQKEYDPLGSFILGHPGQIDGPPGGTLHNRLFVVEKYFSTRDDAMDDYGNFVNSPDPIFSGILEDIFGDG